MANWFNGPEAYQRGLRWGKALHDFIYKYIFHFACYAQVALMAGSILAGDFQAGVTAATFAIWAWLAWDYRRQRDDNEGLANLFANLVLSVSRGEVQIVRVADKIYNVEKVR